jgi:hypothetical protein
MAYRATGSVVVDRVSVMIKLNNDNRIALPMLL